MPKHVERTREVCRYPYTDARGALRFEKVRYEILNPRPGGRSKTFRYYNPATSRLGKPAGADALLYRLPAVLAAAVAGEIVHWCEGEADADALRARGVVATTHHQGAGHATPDQAAWLRSTERVVLWADRDIPGAYDVWRRWQLLLAAGVPEEGIVIVVARDGKDARDHLNAGRSVADAVPVPKESVSELAAKHTAASARKAGYRAP